MSSNIYSVKAQTGVDVSGLAQRLPWKFEPYPTHCSCDYHPHLTSVEARLDSGQLIGLSDEGLTGELQEYGLECTFEFTYWAKKPALADVETPVWVDLLDILLAELLAAGPSYGRISDAHGDPPIIWSPRVLYVDPAALESRAYLGLIDRWPGIDDVQTNDLSCGDNHLPWLSGRPLASYRFVDDEAERVGFLQFEKLLEGFADRDGSEPASALVEAVEDELGPIENSAVLISSIVRSFPGVADRIRIANDAWRMWSGTVTKSDFDRLLHF